MWYQRLNKVLNKLMTSNNSKHDHHNKKNSEIIKSIKMYKFQKNSCSGFSSHYDNLDLRDRCKVAI